MLSTNQQILLNGTVVVIELQLLGLCLYLSELFYCISRDHRLLRFDVVSTLAAAYMDSVSTSYVIAPYLYVGDNNIVLISIPRNAAAGGDSSSKHELPARPTYAAAKCSFSAISLVFLRTCRRHRAKEPAPLSQHTDFVGLFC